MHCPHCGSTDHYSRFFEPIPSETSQVNTATMGVVGEGGNSSVGVGNGKGRDEGIMQSDLATKHESLSPDELPMIGCGVLSVIYAFIAFGISGSIFYGVDRGLISLVGSGFFLLLGVVLIVFRKAMARGEIESRVAHRLERRRLDLSWYCEECEEFSLPDQE